MRWTWLVTGALAVAVGAVWTLQGLGVLAGSPMSGQTLWLVVGLIVTVAGLALLAVGLRRPN
jgi:hypothetical protein